VQLFDFPDSPSTIKYVRQRQFVAKLNAKNHNTKKETIEAATLVKLVEKLTEPESVCCVGKNERNRYQQQG
jgi:hypothetical protein